MTTEPIPEALEAAVRTVIEVAAPVLRRQGAVQALREAAKVPEFGQPIGRWLNERADEMEAGNGGL